MLLNLIALHPIVTRSGFLLDTQGLRCTLYVPPLPVYPQDIADSGPKDFAAEQFAGLRVWIAGAVRELCLVAVADAPTGMGGVLTVNKNGTYYSAYLVEVGGIEASPVMIQTTTGVKAIRNKT
jgi:hypothetical protein